MRNFLIYILLQGSLLSAYMPLLPYTDDVQFVGIIHNKVISYNIYHGIKFQNIKTGRFIKAIPGKFSSVCISRNRIYAGTKKGEIVVIDPFSMKKIRVLKVLNNPIDHIASSRDGEVIVLNNKHGIIDIRESRDFKRINTILTDMEIYGIRISSDKKYIAGMGENPLTGELMVKVWRMKTGKLIRSFAPYTTVFELGSDNKIVYCDTSNVLKALDVRNGKVKWKIPGIDCIFASSVLTPDGKYLIFEESSGKIYKINSKSGKIEETFHDSKLVEFDKNIYFAPIINTDSRNLVSGYLDGGIRLIDLGSGEEIWYVRGSRSRINSIDVKNNLIAVGSGDGFVKLIRLSKNLKVRLLGSSEYGPVNSVKFSPGGRYLYSAGEELFCFYMWDIRRRRLIHEFCNGYLGNSPNLAIYVLEVSEDGKFIVSGDFWGSMSVWNAKKRKLMYKFKGPDFLPEVSISQDNRFIAAGGADSLISVWKFGDEDPIWSKKNLSGEVSAVKIIGNKVLIGDEYGNLKFLDIKTGKLLKKVKVFEDDEIIGIKPLNKNILLVGGYYNGVVVLGKKSGKILKIFETFPGLQSFDLLKGGKLLVAGGVSGILEIWNFPSDKKLANIFVDNRGKVLKWRTH